MHARSTGSYSWLLSSRWVVRLSSVVSASVRWKCGRWKLTAQHTPCRKCSPLSLMTSTVVPRCIKHRGRQPSDGTGHAGILQRTVERDSLAGHQHRTGRRVTLAQTGHWCRVTPAPDCANSDGSKSVKDLLKFLKAQTKTEEFDAIKIALASPDMIRSWSFGEVKSRKPLTTVRSNQSVTAFSAPVSLGQ